MMAFSTLLATTLLLMMMVSGSRASEDIMISNLQTQLPFDVNHKLATHAILYTPSCGRFLISDDDSRIFAFHPVTGDALIDLGLNDNDAIVCHAVLVERGVDRKLIHAVMPHKRKTPEQSMADFIEASRKVEICFLNYLDQEHPLQTKWIHPQTGEKKNHMELHYGERKTRCFASFLGHEFEVYQNDDTEKPVALFTVEYTTVIAFGVHVITDHRPPSHDFDAEIARTLRTEWTRHQRVTRTFSPLGFSKGRLPDDVFGSMSAFFYNNRQHAVLEEWGGKGVFVNWWETDCSFIQIPWQLKNLWQERLRNLVQDWAGVPIEQTDMYGLRRYEQGARLLTHVDRVTTHAVSLIVNIAQST